MPFHLPLIFSSLRASIRSSGPSPPLTKSPLSFSSASTSSSPLTNPDSTDDTLFVVQDTDPKLVAATGAYMYQRLEFQLSRFASPEDPFDERKFSSSSFLIPVLPSRAAVQDYFARLIRRGKFHQGVIVGAALQFTRILSVTRPHAWNWRVLILMALNLAQKLTDDLALAANQLPELFSYATRPTPGAPHLATPRLVHLEVELLKLLQFNVNVTAEQYATQFNAILGRTIAI